MTQPSPAPFKGRGLRQSVKALHHRDFALFWTGALVSNAGTWMQNVTVPFVLFELTHSAVWVGFSAFVQFFPSVILGPIAGALADRIPRRTMLLWNQAALGLLAMGLWAAWVGHVRRPAILVLLMGANGVVSGLGVPAWQAFVSELVPRTDLLNAVTLNSAQFNAARALGPAAGGLVLASYGPSWAFLFNGVSYVAVIAALLMIKAKGVKAASTNGGILRQFVDGVRYARRHTGIRVAIGIVIALAVLAMPLATLTPVFANRVYHVGAGKYGWLAAAYGGGAVVGAVVVGVAGDSLRRGQLVVTALLIYGLGLIGFGLVPNYYGGVAFIALCGAAYLAVAAALNTSIQLLVAEQVRGRVLAVYLMCLTAGYPLGSLLQSWLADLVGAQVTVVGAGVLLLAVPAYLLAKPVLSDSLDRHTHWPIIPAGVTVSAAVELS
jgi:MFS family permease